MNKDSVNIDWTEGQDVPDSIWKVLPRWMRMWHKAKYHPHQGEKEKARRRRQIEKGMLKVDHGRD